MTEHAVVIAGAGPTGLMLAGELALAGIDVAIFERRANQELIGYKASAAPAVTNVVIFPTASISGNVTLSPHSTSFGATSQFGTDFSLGAITEGTPGSSITKGGLGAVSFTGANTYSGNTTVTNGILFLKGGASIAAPDTPGTGGTEGPAPKSPCGLLIRTCRRADPLLV